MNNFLTAFGMCLGMFTALPLPKRPWNAALRTQSTACLPLVGLVVGLLWAAGAYLARRFLPGMLAAAVVAALPAVLTGFMHLDGYMDTSDALLSWRSREERVKILKDVHAGSFSVVMLGLLLMFQFAASCELKSLGALIFLPVLSRAGSAAAVLCLKPLGHSEYAQPERTTPRGELYLVGGAALVALAGLVLCGGLRGLAAGAAAIAGYALAMWRSVHALGGVSGDLAGFSLTISELCGLAALAIF